jgi:ElaB/YqjD/DUF883 family membrane-anchored ribosome-binding protein
MSALPTYSSTTDTAERLADRASGAMHAVRDRVMPAASRLASQAEDLAHRSADALLDRGTQLRDRALDIGDRSVRYARDEPVKTVLIAAAAGAALIAVLALLGSRRTRF